MLGITGDLRDISGRKRDGIEQSSGLVWVPSRLGWALNVAANNTGAVVSSVIAPPYTITAIITEPTPVAGDPVWTQLLGAGTVQARVSARLEFEAVTDGDSVSAIASNAAWRTDDYNVYSASWTGGLIAATSIIHTLNGKVVAHTGGGTQDGTGTLNAADRFNIGTRANGIAGNIEAYHALLIHDYVVPTSLLKKVFKNPFALITPEPQVLSGAEVAAAGFDKLLMDANLGTDMFNGTLA